MRWHLVYMLTGRNPTRRNRNIGTARRGHGQNNQLVIPSSRECFSALDRIGRYRKEERQIEGLNVSFIVEELSADSVHPCTVDDVARVLGSIPASDWAGIKTIVFRQPTRKQAILNPVWGRLRYAGEVSTGHNYVVATGPMILFDAIDENLRITWPASLNPQNQVELNRLRVDGHVIERAGRSYIIKVTASSARSTQLYRTLFHEVGHWFDWLGKVEQPGRRGESYDDLIDIYFARPVAEREAFARRYAEDLRKRLSDAGRTS